MKVYKLENLSCAHCAATIEETLAGLDCVQSVRLQFATSDLHIATTDLEEVRRTVARIEPEVRVLEPDPSGPSSVSEEAGEPVPWVELGLPTLVLVGFLAAGTLAGTSGWVSTLAYAAVYLVTGWPVLRLAARNLVQGRVFDENFLMAVATAAAWFVAAGAEAASVMVFYRWGEFLQDRAVARSRRSLGALLASRPRFVRVWGADGTTTDRDPAGVPAGTVFEVRAGEQIPLDGEVLSGQGTVDTAALTGESLPRAAGPGSEVQAGTLNLDAVLRVRSSRPFGQSLWSGILESVDRALEKKAPLERFVTRFARTYTPAVLILATVLFLGLALSGLPWSESLYRSLVLLVISCPCALVISIPLTYLGAIGAGSRKGLLIRDAGALDRLARVDAAAFDKTGTLTEGRPRVKGLFPAQDEAALRACLDAGFAASSHPLGRAWGPSSPAPEDALETRGQGVVFSNQGVRCAVGRRDFLVQKGFPGVPDGPDAATVVHAASEVGYLGRVEFEDPAKADAAPALGDLRTLGLAPQAVLSGDAPSVVEAWGRAWSVEEARGGLLPEDKLAFVDRWEGEGRRVLFVGDGMNDAPVLARASVGVSLGAGASAAAIETADVAVLDGSPRQIPRLVRLGRRTRTILYQNIGLALGIKAVFFVLGGLGLAGLWEAVFADVGVALLAVANSLRAARSLE
jgi:Cd2+/Zn2+-exporting ATPase